MRQIDNFKSLQFKVGYNIMEMIYIIGMNRGMHAQLRAALKASPLRKQSLLL
jgi:hypothetical protein